MVGRGGWGRGRRCSSPRGRRKASPGPGSGAAAVLGRALQQQARRGQPAGSRCASRNLAPSTQVRRRRGDDHSLLQQSSSRQHGESSAAGSRSTRRRRTTAAEQQAQRRRARRARSPPHRSPLAACSVEARRKLRIPRRARLKAAARRPRAAAHGHASSCGSASAPVPARCAPEHSCLRPLTMRPAHASEELLVVATSTAEAADLRAVHDNSARPDAR